MSILKDLYANEYFGIVLFCVIAFLILLFIIVLFFGLNDAKKTKKQQINKEKLDDDTDTFMKFDDTVKLDVVETKEEIEPIKEEVKEEQDEEKIDFKKFDTNEIKVIKKPVIDLDRLLNNKVIDEDEVMELPKVKKPQNVDSETYDIK